MTGVKSLIAGLASCITAEAGGSILHIMMEQVKNLSTCHKPRVVWEEEILN